MAGRSIKVPSRKHIPKHHANQLDLIPEQSGGLECVIPVDGIYAGLYRFRDAPRLESVSFMIEHLGSKHNVSRVMLVPGDRKSDVNYLAQAVGINEVHASQSPGQKVAIVREHTAQANTIFVGDEINDAPALGRL